MRMYVDDIRNPKGEFDSIVRSSSEAIEYFNTNGCPNFISFDHDLGGEDTAMRIVKYMIESDLDTKGFIPEDFSFYVHSANPIGKANIEGYLNRYLNHRSNNEI